MNTVHCDLAPTETETDGAERGPRGRRRRPPLMPSLSSRCALETVVNAEPLEISSFDRVRYDELSQRIRRKQQNEPTVPRLRLFDRDDLSLDPRHRPQTEWERPAKRRRLDDDEMERKEEAEFVAKRRVNAPVLILAEHKGRGATNSKQKEAALSTFGRLCHDKGYRVQNVLFERDFEIWIVKA